MQVAIAGGHGKIALGLARLLHDRGDEVRSLIRDPGHGDDVRIAGAEPVVCDLEAVTDAELARAVEGSEAVVFAAGAGPGSGAERKWTVDHGGAVKLIAAARIAAIDRYLMISSVGADPDAPGEETFAVYLRAKGKADAELIESGLAYTIVRPVRLTDDPGSGRVEIGERVERGRIPREDVAAVLAALLHDPATASTVFELTSGELPIDEAIRGMGP